MTMGTGQIAKAHSAIASNKSEMPRGAGPGNSQQNTDRPNAHLAADMKSEARGMQGEAAEAQQWHRVRNRLKVELGEDVYNSWFSRVDLDQRENGTVQLSVPTRFLKQWIQAHYNDRLINLWRSECDDIRRIELRVRGAIRAQANGKPANAKKSITDGSGRKPVAGSAAQADRKAVLTDAAGSPLDTRLSFASYVSGRSNELALAAAKQIATAPAGEDVKFNPLFIHASVGLGKTHLLQAVAREIQLPGNGRRAMYLTAERFMYKFVAALKTNSALDFKDTLRGIDVLMIDDLQFLYGKQIQQEFCHTLNALIDGARQVIVAADRPPQELDTLDMRVRSRLSGGLVAEISAPDFDLRRRILERRVAAARQAYPAFTVSDPVLDYIAQLVTSNGRDLDGAVNRLIAHNQLTGSTITIEMAESSMRDLIRTREPRRIRIEDIQRVVSKHYKVTKADLLSARRTRTIVRPRQIAMYLAKMMTPRSLPEIGRRFGGRDHTTVLHAVRKIETMVGDDVTLAEEIELLKRMLDH